MNTTSLQFLQPGQRFTLACDPDVKGIMLRKSDCSVTVKVTGGIQDVEFEDPRTGEKRTFRAERGRTTNWSTNTQVIPGDVIAAGEGDEEQPRIRRKKRGADPVQSDHPAITSAIAAGMAAYTPEPGPKPAPPRPADPPPGSEAQAPAAAPVSPPSTPNPAPEPPAAPKPTKPAATRKPKPAATRNDQEPTAPKPPKPTTEGKMSAIDAAEKVLGEEGRPLTAKQLVDIMAAKGYWSSPGGKTPHATLNSAIMREINTKGDDSRFAKHPEGGFTLSIL